MFGDVPDTTVATVRFGSGTASDTREGSMHRAERVRLGLADCEERVGLREEGRDAARHDFRRPKMSDDKTGYTAAIVIRWGVKWTLNAMKLGMWPTYTIIRLHANSHHIPRTFSGHL